MSPDSTAHLYGQVASQYVASGLGSPLPVPIGQKAPPPVGYTGRGGERPTDEQLGEWAALRSRWNVAIRMASDVMGVDVDAHGDKNGAASLAKIEKEHGHLPETFISTARGAGSVSGIYWFRLPQGVQECSLHERWAGGGIDIIRSSHRYAMVSPSVHPIGNRYRWYKDGVEEPHPINEELPVLPGGWIVHLTGDCECFAVRPLPGVESLGRTKTAMRQGGGHAVSARFSDEARRRGARKILDRHAERLAGQSVGDRNNALYRTAFHLFGRHALAERSLSVAAIRTSLMMASGANWLENDSGPHAVDATIRSAFDDAERAYRAGEFDG